MQKALTLSFAGAAWLLVGAVGAGVPAAAALAQTPIWRCGNEYTDQPGERPEARGCRLLEGGGNLSVVEGRRPTANPAPASADAGTSAVSAAARTPQASSERPPGQQRVERTEQQARDRDARLILETELRRAQDRVRSTQAEFDQSRALPLPNGHGDAVLVAQRNEELRRRLERAQGDVTAIKREISRLPPLLPTAGAAGGSSAGQFIALPAAPAALSRPAAPR